MFFEGIRSSKSLHKDFEYNLNKVKWNSHDEETPCWSYDRKEGFFNKLSIKYFIWNFMNKLCNREFNVDVYITSYFLFKKEKKLKKWENPPHELVS